MHPKSMFVQTAMEVL